MRLLHVLGQHPAKTGSGTSTRAVIRELKKRGHPQFAVYGLNADQEPVDVGCAYEAVVFSEEKDGQLLFGMSDTMPYDSLRFCDMTAGQYKRWARKFLRAIRRAVQAFAPDVIIGHHLHLLTALAEKYTDVPVVGVCHGTDLAQLRRNAVHRAHVRKGLAGLRLIVTNSPTQVEEVAALLAYPKERIRVLGGGYDPAVFYPGTPPAPPPYEIVYAGKISEHKGLRPLYHALARLPQDGWRLTVAGTGEGEETERIVALGEALRLPIRYAGFLEQEALASLYRRSHLFVLPSFAEGLSLATLEALGAGLSCVVMDWPNLCAFLPQAFSLAGQITFVERVADQPIDASHPDFFVLVDRLQEAIGKNRSKMFLSGSSTGIIPTDEITWAGRVACLESWITDPAFGKGNGKGETKNNE